MANVGSFSDELQSWKEIAAYLGVTVRTAQNWEQERGLPVRRLPGARGRVTTTVEELEAWKRSAIPARPGEHQPGAVEDTKASVAEVRRSRKTLLLLVLAGAALILIIGAWSLRGGGPKPASIRLAENSAVVFDEGGRELWRKVFAGKLESQDLDTMSWIGDLDGDGQTELLFVETTTPFRSGSVLHCYSQDGRERWQFKPGKPVRTVAEAFTGPYYITHIGVERLGGRKEMRIVVEGSHYLYYPSQIAMLAMDGELIREYWHSGNLNFLLFADVNNDDRPEILTAGIHNASGSATLVALDPDTMGGASREENQDYQLLGFAPGNEVARILFPRSCMNRKFEAFVHVGRFWTEPGEIDVELVHRGPTESAGGAGVYYHLKRDLSLNQFTLGSSFEARHRSAYETGEIDHPLSKREIAELRHLRYLQGGPLEAARP